MKNLLFILMVSLSIFSYSQTYLLQEDFENGYSDWTSATNSTKGWLVYNAATYAHSGNITAGYEYSTVDAADAYFFFSALYLDAGTVYDVAFWQRVYGAAFPEKFELTVGTTNTIAAQSTVVDYGSNNNDTYTQRTATYTPTTSGIYYFAIHCYSDVNQAYLFIDDVTVSTNTCKNHSCSAPTNIGILPYNASNLTTCGNCNTYSSADACGSLFMDGSEYVFTYTPTTDGWVDIQLTTAHDGLRNGAAVFLLDNCPSSGANCIASSTVQYPSNHGSPNVVFDMVAGQTYYIVVANDPLTTYNTHGCLYFDIDIAGISHPTPTAEDCFGAQPICGSGWHEDTPGNGQGGFPSEINSSTSCLEGERNGNWYSFTVESSGTIQVLIDPDYAGTSGDATDNADDYDFALYNVTSAGCEGIFDGTSPEMACNYLLVVDGEDGNTGVNSVEVAGGNLSFENDVNVVAGETYMLYISQWSVSTHGFTITLGGTADYIDDAGPELTTVDQPLCGDNTVTVYFSEGIDCSQVDVSDFNFTNPGSLTVTGATSPLCDAGGTFTNDIILTLSGTITDGGTYTVALVDSTIADVCGHVNSAGSPTVQFTIVTPTPSISGDNAVCSNDLGDIYSTTNNGGNTYSWATSTGTISGSSTNNSATINWGAAATATVSVTETITATGCATTDTYSVTVNALPTADAGTNDALCVGQTTAQLNASGAGSGSYAWSPSTGLTATNIYNPVADPNTNTTYTVIVTDANGCTDSDDIAITANIPPVPTAGGNDVCVDENLDLTSAPNSMTTYYWEGPNSYTSNSQNPTVSASATIAMSGTYNLTVTDANTCTGIDDITITVNPNPTPIITGSNSVCASSTETYTVTSNAGNTYAWNVSGGTITSGTGSNIITVDWGTGAAGTVDIIETVSSTGCSSTDSESITINPLPNVYAGANQTIPNGTSTSINDATVNGSTSPTGFDYSWSPSGDLVDGSILHPTTNNLNSTTVFTLTVEDQTTHCTSSSDVTINISGGALSVITSTNDEICIGESVNITSNGSGGSGTYTYSWTSNPVGFTSSSQNISVSPSTTTTYTVEVDDGFNTVNENVVITVNDLPTVSINSSDADTTLCLGEDIILTATGNAQTYLWTSITNGIAFTPTATADYIVTATNTTTTCQNFDTITVTVNPLPTVMANTNETDSAVCFGDSLFLFGSGNADSYTWDFATDNAYFVPTTTADYIVTGTYNVSGCENTDTITITVNALPSIDNITETNVTNCPNPDGSIDITVSGGTPTYQYSIDAGNTLVTTSLFQNLNGGTYSIYVEDINGCTDTSSATIVNPSAPAIDSIDVTDILCNGDNTGGIIIYSAGAVSYSIDNGTNTQADSSFTNLIAGNYTVWVSDAGSCVTVGNATINQATAIQLDSIVTPAICGNTGSAQIIATGGTIPYSYLWSTTETTETINNLAANNYTCTVTDDNLCFETITVVVPDGGAIPNIVSTFTNVLCYGGASGSITSVLDNNNSPFTFTWSHNGSLNDSIANNLVAGVYSVTISDSYGCSDSDTITITEPIKPLEVSISNTTNLDCYNDSTASISLFTDGGTPNYTYIWSNNETTSDITNIPYGLYSVTVTDNNSCTDTISQIITNPSQILISDSSYIENNYGVIEVAAIGGTPEYTYDWSNGESNAIITNLFSGNYWLTVTDANGCMVENFYKIEIPLIIPSVITPNDDGKNDFFRITNIDAFKQIDIKVFNRWGDVIFSYDGTGSGYEDSSQQWDGTYNGKELPIGSYVYIIDLKNGEEPYTGTVTIVR